MSFRAVSWAFDAVRGLTATQKLILLALAEFANDADETWRSREAIAERAECSLSAVNKGVKHLEELGLLSIIGRFAWCNREEGSCASKEPHKHRSGSLYRLHLNVTTTPQVEERESTLAKSANVEIPLESRGKPHIGKKGECGSTFTRGGVPHSPPRVSVLREEPPIEPPTRPDLSPLTTESVGSAADFASGVAAPDGALPQGTVADLELVAKCLPEHLRALDAQGLGTVAELLRERLESGWTPGGIWKLMDQPLPAATSRVAGVVAYRLKKNVAPNLAPVKPGPAARAQAVEPVISPAEAAWDALVWTPTYEAAVAATSGYAAAGKAAATRIKTAGVSKGPFTAAWDTLGDLPDDQRGVAALAALGVSTSELLSGFVPQVGKCS